MCGIFCEICFCNKTSTMDDQVMKRIKNRGPDKSNSLEIALGDDMKAFLYGAVLWMQGPELAPQPVETEQGVLLYNGDIFDETWPSNISDTLVIKDKLHDKSNTLSEEYIIQQLKSFKGPFAMIYLDKINKKIYFMRDRIGRSTLLFHKSKNSIIISNVLGRNYNCVEVPATCIQILNLNTNTIKVYPWDNNELKTEEYLIEDWLEQLKMQQSLPDDEFYFEYIEEQFKENDDIIKLIESTAASTQCKLSAMKILIEDNLIKKTVLNVTELLEKSIKLRLQKQPNRCKKCLNTEGDCKHCTVGILFSGGLDCTILAVLADKYLPREQSIDLINVAFKKDEKSTFDVPDRLTGRQSLQELQKLCPTRDWIFREVNVSKEEQEKYQEDIIGDLVYPRETILDESLGTALWFAARGQDCLHDVSTSRVLLIGSGADELFGGYTRHRNAFKRKGWQGLNKELLLDWKRISFRNLARDNRVICDHGRQPRMPYLDEDFTNYILQLKPWLRCFPSEDLGIGMGDKLMLRLVALNLGLSEAVILPKRALQFGSRIANKKEKGSDISKTFKNKNIKI
ncbi:asparagine synthetase domain-containing protein CG17486 isoform X2 [Spodoptera frugiperda]|uniref:Asparagine synthetase domain-containing protein CG17486 isoform X2 n=1 Tax=Spodoptera frugiperda TaxID=7108 RepID=A0A9R0DAW4_SPOFR|nr:asparagine synthetase domain-containing protein CG17486 isoform X2 [Spodoptera frugiperda]